VPRSHLINRVCEDVTELASISAYSPAGLAIETELEPGLNVREGNSRRFLGVEGATVSFGKGDARISPLRGVSAMFERGTLSLVMGPSGSGKTTLLSLLGCLLSPTKALCSWMMYG